MSMRSYYVLCAWFLLIYVLMLLVGGIGWMTTNKDQFMVLVFIALAYYHGGSYFLDTIPVKAPRPPSVPPQSTF